MSGRTTFNRTIEFSFILSTISGLVAWNPASANAQGCSTPVPLTNSEREASTKGALDFLKGVIGKIDIGFEFKSKQTEILSRYPNADQAVFNAMYYISVCSIIEKAADLNTVQKFEMLTKARGEIFSKAAGLPTPSVAPQASALSVQAAPAESGIPPVNSVRAVPSDEKNARAWGTQYLKPPPSILNDYNKHFVIVSSVKSKNEGQAKIAELRNNFQDLDFVLYEPYKNNTYWAVVLASWVSKSEAMQALSIAKARIASDSFIWTF